MPGSYDRCLRAIHLLMDRGLPLKLKTVGTKVNRHEVASMKEFAEQELGVEFKFDSLMSPRIDCSRAPLAVRMSPEDVVALDMHWPKIANEHRQGLAGDIDKPPIHAGTVYSCGGGVRTFAIDPYGHMSICVLSHMDTYDIRQGGARAGWEHFLLSVRQRKATRPTKCTECRLHAVCSMCPANGELENGDPESPVEFLCEVAHLRALALGFQVPQHGDCEFCNDSDRHAALRESARRITAQEITPATWTGLQSVLPILNNSQAASSCGGCGTFH
jgi:radical SAM protein with 4Fe4S-binding SPASM domain